MQTLTQSAMSTQYQQTLIQVTSVDGYDPTSDTITWAFTNAQAFPAVSPSEWSAGSWVTYPGDQWWAQVLVGPDNGGVSLSAGLWQAHLKITDDPEVPVLQPFLLQITSP